MRADPPAARRFSQLYLERGAPTRDSERLRIRISGHLREHFGVLIDRDGLTALVQRTLGREIPGIGNSYDWRDFLVQCDLRDFLDTVTLVYLELKRHQFATAAIDWINFVRVAMREENVGYRIDDEGVVHFAVDKEFERNRAAAIDALKGPRYRAALDAFEGADRALDNVPTDTKSAIRGIFDAAEVVFKLLFEAKRVARLGSTEIDQLLKPVVQKLYANNKQALDAANLVINAYSDWVNAAHQYRHGAGIEEPVLPPHDLAVAMISTGASFVRWLAQIDQQVTARANA